MSTSTQDQAVGTQVTSGERADLLAMLAAHRHFLCFTTRDLTDEQARQRTTVSELCLGGLIKHVTSAERGWTNFILEGPSALGGVSDMTEADYARRRPSSGCCPTKRWRACWPTTPTWPAAPTSWSRPCLTWTLRTRYRRRRGSRPARSGRPGTRCCTSSPRPRSTPGTRTSSASHWTARRRCDRDRRVQPAAGVGGGRRAVLGWPVPGPAGSPASVTWAAVAGGAEAGGGPCCAPPRRWAMTNQASPATVAAIATKKFSRSPRKWAEESTRIVSSKIRYAEYPATYSANRPCGAIRRWWPSQTSAAASARSKIISYRNDGWNVVYFRSAAGIPEFTRAA